MGLIDGMYRVVHRSVWNAYSALDKRLGRVVTEDAARKPNFRPEYIRELAADIADLTEKVERADTEWKAFKEKVAELRAALDQTLEDYRLSGKFDKAAWGRLAMLQRELYVGIRHFKRDFL